MSPTASSAGNLGSGAGDGAPLQERDLYSALPGARRTLGDRPDVLDVRLGWLFRDGWITDQRAWVVTVPEKLSAGALRALGRDPLPDEYAGLPVDVTTPTPEDLLVAVAGPARAARFLERAAVLPSIRYAPPPGVTLRPVTGRMRVIAHVSPDAGWRELSTFLAGTRRRLVVGMYDCGAPHIVEALQTAGRAAQFDKLTLVMQRGASVGSGTKADDLSDEATVEALRATLAPSGRFEHAWVRIGEANGWVASSYHIKVAVSDERAFWLSSGNWQSSNQPAADPLAEEPRRRRWLDRYNRDWHCIIEHAGLARRLAAYLLHDFRNNLPGVRTMLGEQEGVEVDPDLVELPDLLVPEAWLERASEAEAAWRFFEPFDETRVFTVRPLLTPDNYHRYVLELVRSAEEELLIQNQTFNAPRAGQAALQELIDAVKAAQAKGVRVRIIFRVLMPAVARQTLEQLKDYGVDLSCVKVQPNCHTKGIIVDRQRVLLGSQNWSNHGVSANRDASLLFDDAALARYFAEIFEHDWNFLADRKIGSEWLALRLAGEEAGAEGAQRDEPGMVALSWKAYRELA